MKENIQLYIKFMRDNLKKHRVAKVVLISVVVVLLAINIVIFIFSKEDIHFVLGMDLMGLSCYTIVIVSDFFEFAKKNKK